MISIHFSLKMDWINSEYKHRIKQKQIGEYIQTINIEFEFEDILNLSSVYSKFIHWIFKPMATLRAMYRRPKPWDYHMRKVGVCRRESGGGVGHLVVDTITLEGLTTKSTYRVLKTLHVAHGLVGWSIRTWLAHDVKDRSKEVVIRDTWAVTADAQKEVNILRRLKGLQGVPAVTAAVMVQTLRYDEGQSCHDTTFVNSFPSHVDPTSIVVLLWPR